MQLRSLGESGIQVAPLAFGGNVFGWTVDEKASFSLLDTFIDQGFNLIDTADVYSRWVSGNHGGESERILGKWMKLRGHRHRVVLATKVGKEMGPGQKGLSRKYMLGAVENSLKRLQTDYIDLYQSHDDDASVPMEEVLETFGELIRAGKVRAIGASNFSAPRLLQALETSQKLGLPRYECLQPLYNLYDRQPFEQDLQEVCWKQGLGVIPFYSLASGFLSGKYRSEKDFSKSPRGKGMKDYLNQRGLSILSALDDLSEKYHCAPASIALSWLISRKGITAPIVSATRFSQWEELLAATRITLTLEDIQILDFSSSYRKEAS
ncbi:MAG: aldo/keto reductase [Chitinophagaceae bacterium]